MHILKTAESECSEKSECSEDSEPMSVEKIKKSHKNLLLLMKYLLSLRLNSLLATNA